MFKKELIGLGLPVIADPTLRFFITFLFIKKGGNRVLINGCTFALVSRESYAQIENSHVLNETFLVLEQVHRNLDIIEEN